MDPISMNRREAIASLLAVSAAGALAACSGEADPDVSTVDSDLDYATPTTFFTDAEMAFLSAISDTIIPDTETAGAVGAGVPDTLQSLASVWGNDDYRRYWRTGIRSLDESLPGSVDRGFSDLSPDERENTLKKHDEQVFNDTIKDRFYRDLKRTIVQAYYMSEIGASEELAYEPVPGDWKGCVPLSDYPKTWAT